MTAATETATVHISFDEENNGEAFWTHIALEDAEVHPWAGRLGDLEVDGIRVSVEDAAEALAYCETVPGWTGGPSFAPHPLLFAGPEAWENYEAEQMAEVATEAAGIDHGTLTNYQTGESIRPATEQERADSDEAAEFDGGSGVIEVDGVSCYVGD